MSFSSDPVFAQFRSLRRWLASDAAFHPKLIAAAAAGVLAIALLAGVFLTFHWRERSAGYVRDATFAVQRVVDRVEADLAAVEGTLREFALSGDSELLDAYNVRRVTLSTRLGKLAALVAADPMHAEAVERIRADVDAWIYRIAEPQIALVRDGGDAAAVPIAQKGAAMLGKVHLRLANLARQQTEAWEAAQRRTDLQRRWQTGGFVVLSVLAIALVLGSSSYSYAAFRRHLARSEDAETRLRLIVENTLDALLTTDAYGIVHLVNPAAERLFGAPAAELVGRPISTLVEHECFAQLLDRIGGETIEADAHQLGSSVTRRVELSLNTVPSADGRHFVVVIRDIHERAAADAERRRYQLSLAEEKERLAVTLSSIGDGCITIDNQGRVVLFNPVAERMLGCSADAVRGCFLAEVFHLTNPRSRRPLRRPLDAVIATGSAAELGGVVTVTSFEGVERLVEINASPLRDPHEQKVGAVLVLRDVTERQRTAEERQKAEKLESLGIAAGGIAHDFNNLLTAILGNISLALMGESVDEATRERLTGAKRASLRAQELAQQLLTFAKGGAPVKAEASLGVLVRDTVTFHLRGSKTRVEFHVADDLWAAEVDAGQISQVIQNLAINADQAMPAGGTLRVSCANLELLQHHERVGLPPGRYVKITVRDEGIGIPEENLKKIFDPYFTTKPKGSGLGLATSYSIVKAHGGIIDCTSLPGEGTTFYLFLPACSHAAPPAVGELELPALPAPPAPAPSAARVLVLDDEEAICALVSCALEPLGIEVVEVNDASSALDRYREALGSGRRFDLVISDLTIPGGMGGLEAVRRLREIDPAVRAIVSSGYATDPVMANHREHGFCAMIAKPYEIAALARVVAELLREQARNVIAHDFAA